MRACQQKKFLFLFLDFFVCFIFCLFVAMAVADHNRAVYDAGEFVICVSIHRTIQDDPEVNFGTNDSCADNHSRQMRPSFELTGRPAHMLCR